MGSHCVGEWARSSPYSPSLAGRLAANRHPTAGASLEEETPLLLATGMETLRPRTRWQSLW
ncbi:MAG: hypothetical protein V7K40_02760 [Nostoc sp.]|uniref:hypothetical protein n=1 Tax=Nostoc sp. TaxID=1180 RepID=UPI002FF7F1B7